MSLCPADALSAVEQLLQDGPDVGTKRLKAVS